MTFLKLVSRIISDSPAHPYPTNSIPFITVVDTVEAAMSYRSMQPILGRIARNAEMCQAQLQLQ